VYEVRMVGLVSEEAAKAVMARFPAYDKAQVVH
jgi:hypothetical protein